MNAIATILIGVAVIIGAFGDNIRTARIDQLEQKVQQLESKGK